MVTDQCQTLSDTQLQLALHDELCSYVNEHDGVAVVEAAGAVLSPAPSGNTQADAYRPLRLPALLVGDSRLGGIGSTISAWESLHIRGYDVQAVALFEEHRYQNAKYLTDYFFDRGVHTLAVEPPPEVTPLSSEDVRHMEQYYQQVSQLPNVSHFVDMFFNSHHDRMKQLKSMPDRTVNAIWHPFMQHTERNADSLVVIDSAYDDFFQTYSCSTHNAATVRDPPDTSSLLNPAFDGSASWWTQGLGHGNPKLALSAAYAAGRYGHVMFANAVHQPALELAETLLKNMNNPKLSKVFFTDNGSTGMEVAVKMALRASSQRNAWRPDEDVEILGLTGSYHGDTIGTMDCSEPSIYNQKVEWYRGRGHWLDFPQVRMRAGQWIVEAPKHLEQVLGKGQSFDSLSSIFDLKSRRDDARRYTRYLQEELASLRQQGRKFGALVMEPVILGAGGMMLVDPLYQRCLIDVVRNVDELKRPEPTLDWQGMPVIFDEVFTGLYRLGRFSAATFLDTHPDIVVNAKLLTGGLLPLCTTTASEAIFKAFLSGDKSDALLHGHSYTAHAVGCTVANESLAAMASLNSNGDGGWTVYKEDWTRPEQSSRPRLWSMWSNDFLETISRKKTVDYAFALGSVLAVSLKDPAGSGYASTAAVGLRDRLFNNTAEGALTIHSRVLGNVLYLMAAMTTKAETLKAVQQILLQTMD